VEEAEGSPAHLAMWCKGCRESWEPTRLLFWSGMRLVRQQGASEGFRQDSGGSGLHFGKGSMELENHMHCSLLELCPVCARNYFTGPLLI
jgi:hypothetical protein